MFKSSFFLLLICCLTSTKYVFSQTRPGTLSGKIICVDAGHGGTALTDSYRVGPGGEREEWINLRVAKILQKKLLEKGARVIMTRISDDTVALWRRAKMAVDNRADLFVSIHHNATADPKVNFPIVYFHGNISENQAGAALGKELATTITKYLFAGNSPVSVVSDFTIFPKAGAQVLRGTYGIPAVLAEAAFFSNAAEEQKLKQEDYNEKEAQAYAEALEAFFSKSIPNIIPKNSLVSVPPFLAFQEAERMNETARRWFQDFLAGQALMKNSDTTSIRQAYDLFTRSARSFPDSYVAAECHANRAVLLRMMGKTDEAELEALRVKEFYVKFGVKH
ncbi:N-acetylmuramoyl-L-alanine amidase [Dyadobacter sp. LHD-138]|uniref:N-acetylmuramoyl-L-alanine amidase family protein n=1 Tax=Dyadobacter sp. LHD-138 TaxID=3071413 RepID=UPI0027E00B44|nr:N-acetylmuramoyl-L-alanine amidase [Dyadobacter sp. LHD-138]MDQ6478667.1 N-acetylmuramoyl-L-alanine amidase [Dyadobacter sp. LHD-138]